VLKIKTKLKTLTSPKYWWLSSGIISVIIILVTISISVISAITNFRIGFVYISFEFIIPMLFGVYLANKEKFKINSKKFLFIFFVLMGSVFFLGKLAMALAPMLILILMWIIQITKNEAKWAFGSMMLYMFSGAPGIFAIIYFKLGLMGFLILYISKGAIYGKIMQILYEKKQHK